MLWSGIIIFSFCRYTDISKCLLHVILICLDADYQKCMRSTFLFHPFFVNIIHRFSPYVDIHQQLKNDTYDDYTAYWIFLTYHFIFFPNAPCCSGNLPQGIVVVTLPPPPPSPLLLLSFCHLTRDKSLSHLQRYNQSTFISTAIPNETEIVSETSPICVDATQTYYYPPEV